MISVLCVSDCKPRAQAFFDHFEGLAKRLGGEFVLVRDGVDVHSKGYIESVLDEAIAMTKGDWILRLDDDEKVSKAMERWINRGSHLKYDQWSFPRAHFWGDPKTVILEKYYWPDVQTRLSVRAKSGGITRIHQPSPFGGGAIAPVCLEHWVYLVKSYEERVETGLRYQQIASGHDGGQFRASSFEDEKAGVNVKFCEYNTEGFINNGVSADFEPFAGARVWFAPVTR